MGTLCQFIAYRPYADEIQWIDEEDCPYTTTQLYPARSFSLRQPQDIRFGHVMNHDTCVDVMIDRR